MHVEERNAIAFGNGRAGNRACLAAQLGDTAHRHVSGNDRVRHAAQPAVEQVDIGAAHFRKRRVEQNAAGRELRLGKLAELDWHMWRGHHRGQNGWGHDELSQEALIACASVS